MTPRATASIVVAMTHPTPDAIAAAAPLIAPYIRQTPVLSVEAAALDLPCPVTFKLEHTQITGSEFVGDLDQQLVEMLDQAPVVRIVEQIIDGGKAHLLEHLLFNRIIG